MSYKDTPNSQHDVVTTMARVVSEFKQSVVEEMPNIATVFDHELSYNTALNKYLKENPDTDNPLPLFAYNRSVAEYGDRGLQRRNKVVGGKLKLDGLGVAKYSVFHGEFRINFMYVSKSMEELEKFEVAYYSDEGISNSKKITVKMPQLGDFNYFLEYNELDDIVIEHEGAYYKAIIGSVVARGMYFTFTGNTNVISEVNARIIASRKPISNEVEEVLSENIIQES